MREKIKTLRAQYQDTFNFELAAFGTSAELLRAHGAMIALDEVLAIMSDPANDGPEVEIIRREDGNSIFAHSN